MFGAICFMVYRTEANTPHVTCTALPLVDISNIYLVFGLWRHIVFYFTVILLSRVESSLTLWSALWAVSEEG